MLGNSKFTILEMLLVLAAQHQPFIFCENRRDCGIFIVAYRDEVRRADEAAHIAAGAKTWCKNLSSVHSRIWVSEIRCVGDRHSHISRKTSL